MSAFQFKENPVQDEAIVVGSGAGWHLYRVRESWNVIKKSSDYRCPRINDEEIKEAPIGTVGGRVSVEFTLINKRFDN